MENIIRVAALVSTVHQLNPNKCCDEIIRRIDELKTSFADIILFPSLSLCGAGSGSLMRNASILNECKKSLMKIVEHTKNMNCYVIVGLPIKMGSKVISVMAAALSGEVVGYIPDYDEYDGLDRYAPGDKWIDESRFKQDFLCGKTRFSVVPGNGKNLLRNMYSTSHFYDNQASESGLLLVPSSGRACVGDFRNSCDTARTVGKSMNQAVVLCSGGKGESSSPHLYKPYTAMFNGAIGEELQEIDTMLMDFDPIFFKGNTNSDFFDHTYSKIPNKKVLPYHLKISTNPFLPSDSEKKREYLEEAFDFQVKSVCTRLKNIGTKKVLVGVSGGLDSTLALLACVKAVETLGHSAKNVIGISMPGFGTTGTTKSNAKLLMEGLGITYREIPIAKSVEQHFVDIGHSFDNTNVTYENAQARERTQILMDIANDESAIVVGTGDLSEEILGFSTFGGDHLSNYNINSCFTKTVLREMLTYHIDAGIFQSVSDILRDILDTPISPELLPPDKNDRIVQKTEEILGPYEIQEFYAYYFIKYNFSVKKLYEYAKIAFGEKYDSEYLKDKMRLFFTRFIKSQFKRSCAPDAAVFVDFPFTGVDFHLSSDAGYEFFTKQIDAL